MAFKMKGSSFYGSPLNQKEESKVKSQAEQASEVVAKNTSGDDDLKNMNVQDFSAVQKDKKGNSFVVSTTDDESYSGDDENVITTSKNTFEGFDYDVDRTAPRDTFLVSNNYPKGHLIDETQAEEGDAQKQSTKVPEWQKKDN